MLENLRHDNKTDRNWICPSRARYPHRWNRRHYLGQWLRDSCFHAEICAELSRHFGDPYFMYLAENELSFMDFQKEDGFVDHMVGGGYFWPITQIPIIAQAVKTIGNPDFIQEILPRLLQFYLYWQSRDDDGLVSIMSPLEGRDTAPEFDWRWETKKPGLGLRLVNVLAKFRKTKIKDLETNCLWVQGLRTLADLCDGRNAKWNLTTIADRSEQAICELCWNEDDQFFYPLDRDDRQIRVASIGGLYPLLLENLPEGKKDALFEHLTNTNEFWTSYPIPVVPQNSPYFNCDEQYYGSCNWRGPTWIDTNRHILEGLVLHGYQEKAEEIADKTLKMVQREGFWEEYNPFTGKGMRVPNYSWSAQVILFQRILNGE